MLMTMGPLLAVMAACIDPVAYGAKPDDGVSDTAAIQKAIDVAIDQHADVCLAEGVFDLDRPGRYASLVVARGPLVIRGTGPDTVLEMNGDGGQSDWYGIWLRGADTVTIQDLAIRATETTNTKEQTHLIQIGKGTQHVLVQRVRMGPMRRFDQPRGEGARGDCIKMIGERDAPIQDVVILDSDFISCDRSGITIQRGIQRLTVAHSAFWDASDAAIDFEPTGPGPLEDFTFYDLAIGRPRDAQGPWAISLGGFRTEHAKNIVVSQCDIQGGGIDVLEAEHVLLDHDHIVQTNGTYATVFLEKFVHDLVITNSTIERLASATAAPVVQVIHAHDESSSHVRIVDNELRQHTDGPVVSLASASDVEVTNNQLTYDGGQGTTPAVEVDSVIGQVDDVAIQSNQIHGPIGPAVRLYAHRAPIGRVLVTGNHGSQAVKSIDCVSRVDRPFRAPIQVGDNDFDRSAATCDAIRPAPRPVVPRRPAASP